MNPSQTTLTTANWTTTLRPSMLYKFARLFGSNPDIISFAGGAPDHKLFPIQELSNAAVQTITSNSGALQYGRDLGELKESVLSLVSRRGINCTPDDISITAGGQHAMDILSRLFINPGGQVMLEELVYTGIQQTVQPFQPDILTVPIDPETGLDVEAVKNHLESGAKPAFLYTIPDAHNPAGVTLCLEKRQQLIQIAQQYNLPIIEDDAYGFLNYDGTPTTPLKVLDNERVIYIGTFSKILSPGLRLGWIIAPSHLKATILVIKQLSMLSVVPFSQHVAATYLVNNDFVSYVERIRCEYGRRRDAMLQSMGKHFPPGARWTRPQSGLFVWAQLPFGIDTEPLVYRAVEEEQVAYIPGKAFVTDPNNRRYDNYLRLSFAKYARDEIDQGIYRLGRLLKKVIQGF